MGSGGEGDIGQVARIVGEDTWNTGLPRWFSKEGACTTTTCPTVWFCAAGLTRRAALVPGILWDVGKCGCAGCLSVRRIPVRAAVPIVVEHRPAHRDGIRSGSEHVDGRRVDCLSLG